MHFFPRMALYCALRMEQTCSYEMLIAICQGREQSGIRAEKSAHVSLGEH